MRTNKDNAVVPRCATAMLMLFFVFVGDASGASPDEQAIQQLIATYAGSVDKADSEVADQIWSNAPEVSFIHPRGEEHGRAQIEADVYRDLMGGTFSERKLTPKDIVVHVYRDTAWSEFHWDFVAKGAQGWGHASYAGQRNTDLP